MPDQGIHTSLNTCLHALGTLTSQLRLPFLLIGDFNATPNNLITQCLNSLNATIMFPIICTSTLKTHYNRIIDYCKASQRIAHLVHG